MNSRRYIWCVIVDLAPIYSVFRLISVGINPLCDYHQKNIHKIFMFIFYPKMAYNVPAVYDIFASPIKETVGFQGL
jgi:hypothetical protein